jgi:hypothetical protein
VTTYAESRAAFRLAADERLTVGGVDVTFFRGAKTVIGEMMLTEPFAYGATTLGFPRIAADFEELGVGDLSFIHENASVLVEAVDDLALGPDATVLGVRYRGLVMDWTVEGRDFQLEVGGVFSGPAQNIDMQPPLARRVRDTGFWAANILETLGLRPSSRFGPTTGIRIPESAGGQTMHDWALDVCALSQDNAGVQRSIMPTTPGGDVWGFAPKDTTTVHVTLYTNDARVVPRLRPNLPDLPNTWFGDGVTKEGVRWRNARYPHIFQGPPPPFPNSGGTPLTVGDTDADTTSDDGVTVLNHNLVAIGRLAITEAFVYGEYTTRTAAAIKEIQDDAGLTVNGSTNLATWKAVFNESVVGYSFAEAKVHPIVQASAVREFDYTSDGSVAGLNDNYDPKLRRKDRTIHFGPGTTMEQGIGFCRGQQIRAVGKQWSGEIDLVGGFGGFAGEWGPDDADFLNDPTTGAAHILSQLGILPGMNAWLPLFDGGTLVHIAGARVDRQSRTVTLTVDTQARDLLDLAAIKARNKEAGRSVRREWYAENRPSGSSGNMLMRDQFFGWLRHNVQLTGGQWNEIDVIVGQHGQVNRVDLRTIDHKAKFVVVFASRDISAARAKRRFGNPLTTGAESWLEQGDVQDLLEERVLLYATGDGKQPCGYWPRRHRNDNDEVTNNPITGRHMDDATWTYIQLPEKPAAMRMLIYPDRDCTLKRGQILYPQLDDVV